MSQKKPTEFVKPGQGLKVRDPKTGAHLPEGGAKVPRNSYWLRRLQDGDVALAEKPKAAKGIKSSADKDKE